MKLALKTRDNDRENYRYEIHRFPCNHTSRESLQTVITDKYETPEELIKADMEDNIPREEYRIMPCLTQATTQRNKKVANQK